MSVVFCLGIWEVGARLFCLAFSFLSSFSFTFLFLGVIGDGWWERLHFLFFYFPFFVDSREAGEGWVVGGLGVASLWGDGDGF
jgi:hypothetical protein